MIRINLLPRDRARSAASPAGLSATQHRVAIGATILLILTVAGLGWWFWSLRQQSQTVDREIVRVQGETAGIRTVLAQVKTFEARKAQLQQRVTIIEQLRKGQAAPARVLDQISRSLPERLWLADLTQVGNDFTLNGFTTSMTALSDFVASLEDTKWFRRPVEIIDSQVMTDPKTGDLVRFSVKASYFDPQAPPPGPAPGPPKR